MFGMAAVADPMVRVLLGNDWLPCIIFVQILSVAEAQVPITVSNLLAYKSLGRSDIYAKLAVLRRSLMLISLAISVFCFDSVEAIAVSFLISAWIDAVVTALPLKKLLGTSLKAQFMPLWEPLMASLLMAAAVYAFGLLNIPMLLKLILQIALGAAVYIAVNLVIKNESLMYVLNILRKRRQA